MNEAVSNMNCQRITLQLAIDHVACEPEGLSRQATAAVFSG